MWILHYEYFSFILLVNDRRNYGSVSFLFLIYRLTMTTKIFLLLVLSAWTAKFEEVKWPKKNFHMTEKKLWGSEVDPKKKSDKVR